MEISRHCQLFPTNLSGLKIYGAIEYYQKNSKKLILFCSDGYILIYHPNKSQLEQITNKNARRVLFDNFNKHVSKDYSMHNVIDNYNWVGWRFTNSCGSFRERNRLVTSKLIDNWTHRSKYNNINRHRKAGINKYKNYIIVQDNLQVLIYKLFQDYRLTQNNCICKLIKKFSLNPSLTKTKPSYLGCIFIPQKIERQVTQQGLDKVTCGLVNNNCIKLLIFGSDETYYTRFKMSQDERKSAFSMNFYQIDIDFNKFDEWFGGDTTDYNEFLENIQSTGVASKCKVDLVNDDDDDNNYNTYNRQSENDTPVDTQSDSSILMEQGITVTENDNKYTNSLNNLYPYINKGFSGFFYHLIDLRYLVLIGGTHTHSLVNTSHCISNKMIVYDFNTQQWYISKYQLPRELLSASCLSKCVLMKKNQEIYILGKNEKKLNVIYNFKITTKVIPWRIERVIWIGWNKNVHNSLCLLVWLTKDIIQYILQFVRNYSIFAKR